MNRQELAAAIRARLTKRRLIDPATAAGVPDDAIILSTITCSCCGECQIGGFINSLDEYIADSNSVEEFYAHMDRLQAIVAATDKAAASLRVT